MSPATFVSFKPWLVAMGNHLVQFRIKERVGDRTKGDNLFYQNVITEDDFYLLEDFNNYPDVSPKFNDMSLDIFSGIWTAGGADTSDGVLTKGVYYNNEGWFHDASNAKVVHKILHFPSASNATGWSIVKLKSRYQPSNGATSKMVLKFTDAGGRVPLEFWLNNTSAYVLDAGFGRILNDALVVPIVITGTHFWEFHFNNTTKKFKIYFDGTQVFPATLFDNYNDPFSGPLDNISFTSGAAADSTTLDAYFDNIKIDWVTTENYFNAWFIRKPAERNREVVGVFPDYPQTFIVRVDATLFPIVKTFKESDEIRNMENLRIYKITDASDISKQIDLVKFIVQEVK